MLRFESKINDIEESDNSSGVNVDRFRQIEPILEFLYEKWWKIEFFGLDRIPATGPAVIVGNQGSVLPWQALMLSYALLKRNKYPRKLYILNDMATIKDKKLRDLLESLGFLEWSSATMKELITAGELVSVFPEGDNGLNKPYTRRYRLEDFDWTLLMPACEDGVEIVPMSAYGFDDSIPVLGSSQIASRLLKLSSFPITPFFPWLPTPLNLASFPVDVAINLLKPAEYDKAVSHDEIQLTAKSVSDWIQGEIQADLNRHLRQA